MSAVNAFSSILSPSWKSTARRVLPSRLELKRPEGSSNEAPLAKVIFTAFLYVSPVQIIPACDHTGTPRIPRSILHLPPLRRTGPIQKNHQLAFVAQRPVQLGGDQAQVRLA